MSKLFFLLFFSVTISACFAQEQTERVLMNVPEYPLLFELNKGESIHLKKHRNSLDYKLELIDYQLFSETNLWIPDTLGAQNYFQATVKIRLNGKEVTIYRRTFEMPVEVDGLRIYVEGIKEWDKGGEVYAMKGLEKNLRFSVIQAGKPWGKADEFIFPVRDFHWKASTYMNTWGALVPYNKLYYHHGDDFGFIPDKHAVVAPFSGEIISSPLPKGDGASNGISILNKNGLEIRFAHMNIETFEKQLTKGYSIMQNQFIAKTGMTWAGRKSQTHDPHLHIAMRYNDLMLSSYPYLTESYLRQYPEEVIAVAGGHCFGVPGDKIILDATRSIGFSANPEITWILHNGKSTNNPVLEVEFKEPGLYCEELIVEDKNGKYDKDFVLVRIFDPNTKMKDCKGWIFYHPHRIKTGDNVLFWQRLAEARSPVMVDFGDGNKSEMKDELYHSYNNPGNYTVTFSTKAFNNQPVTQKVEVVVSK